MPLASARCAALVEERDTDKYQQWKMAIQSVLLNPDKCIDALCCNPHYRLPEVFYQFLLKVTNSLQ